MSDTAMNTARLINMLPKEDQNFAYEFVKKLVKAWDPDYTKLTADEAKSLDAAEKSGFVDVQNLTWDKLQSMDL